MLIWTMTPANTFLVGFKVSMPSLLNVAWCSFHKWMLPICYRPLQDVPSDRPTCDFFATLWVGLLVATLNQYWFHNAKIATFNSAFGIKLHKPVGEFPVATYIFYVQSMDVIHLYDLKKCIICPIFLIKIEIFIVFLFLNLPSLPLFLIAKFHESAF